MANPRVMVGVASSNERDGDEVVAQHLPVVLPARLGVQNQHLVHVARDLHEIEEFDGGGEGGVGVLRP